MTGNKIHDDKLRHFYFSTIMESESEDEVRF